ncbi:hypothetical protein ACFFS4_24925 [Kutzneria kofuensis]|uniref:Uncharacterized protein n=1 Tax=Kutzneria kofuensis TaxID=103725 RepID=A0A7W9KP56_9PSEU|nr:hypothetical protein [Kutzneria kofuensis]MBB5896052.1 hypothetical protein [Kutzneria kofuensis]
MNFNIQFKRTFSHKPWVDTVDRVAAGGDNGFNVRFQALEADLDSLAARIDEINKALNAVAPTVPDVITVNVNPSMNSALPAGQWIYANGESHKDTGGLVKGIIPLTSLPARGKVNTVRVTGSNSGTATVDVYLYRKPFGGQLPEAVASQTGIKSQTPDGRYEIYVTAQSNRAAIDTTNYTYYLEITGHGDNTNDVSVSGIQITCTP